MNKPSRPTAPISPARRAAYDILWRVAAEDAYATNLLASESYAALSREDHALLNELVLGVLRWQRTLDFLIERYAQRPANKLDLETLLVLRMALYQLRWLTRVPAHAALNEAVNLSKASDKPAASALLRLLKDPSWTEIKEAGGRVVYSRKGTPGTEQWADGQPPFELVVGNAPETRLFYRGNEVDLTPYIKGTVARLQLQ